MTLLFPGIKVKKSDIDGLGIFSIFKKDRGDKILTITGDTVTIRDFNRLAPSVQKKYDNWIGISRYRYIDTSASALKYINHSCDPNTALVTPRTLRAIKNIPANTELTMDYSLTEAGQDYNRKCTCKTRKCRGFIGPINKLPPQTFKEYLPYISKNFSRTYVAMNR